MALCCWFREHLASVQELVLPIQVVVQVPLTRVIVIVALVARCLAASVLFEFEPDPVVRVCDTSAPGRERLARAGADAV